MDARGEEFRRHDVRGRRQASRRFLHVADALHGAFGFTYLPRQDGTLNGVVETYRFETSDDCPTWTTNIANGSFANIQNNPSLQEVSFATVEARYFRFTSLRAIWYSGWTSAAEISVVHGSE